MKLRYTSLQVDAGAAEEPTHPSRRTDLDGMPVVVVQPPQPGARRRRRRSGPPRPTARVAYVMTDGAALPIALSDLVARRCARPGCSTAPSPPGMRSAATSRR